MKKKFQLESLLIDKITPLIELNEAMLDESADTNVHGKRLFALNTAMGAQIKEVERHIKDFLYGPKSAS